MQPLWTVASVKTTMQNTYLTSANSKYVEVLPLSVQQTRHQNL